MNVNNTQGCKRSIGPRLVRTTKNLQRPFWQQYVLEERDPERECALLHVVCMEMPTCFVPVFAWMSLKEILRGRLNCFFLCSPPGVASLKEDIVVFSFRLYFTIYFICGMRVQTRNVLQPACQPLFQIETKPFCFVFVFSDVS